MAQDVRYPSSPLDPTVSCIRLLSFEQTKDGHIHGTLHEFLLSKCPPFVALSYTWGSADVVHEIKLNGESFWIRDNLRSALGAIWTHISQDRTEIKKNGFDGYVSKELDRPQRQEIIANPVSWRYFWIDAVCINQENVLERNHQVNMMREIYVNAAFVLIGWAKQASTAVAP